MVLPADDFLQHVSVERRYGESTALWKITHVHDIDLQPQIGKRIFQISSPSLHASNF